MSIQKQAESLKKRLKCQFPLEKLGSKDFQVKDFLESCFVGKGEDLFMLAEQLKGHLKETISTTEKELAGLIQADFDSMLSVPSMLSDFDQEISELFEESSALNQELNILHVKAKEVCSKAKDALQKDQEKQTWTKTKQNQELLERHKSELQEKLVELQKASGLTHGAVFERMSVLLKECFKILGENYDSSLYQVKSDFLYLASKELLTWSCEVKAKRYLFCILKAYSNLSLLGEAKAILRDQTVLPVALRILESSKVPNSIDLQIDLNSFFAALKKEVTSGQLKLFLEENLVKSFWSGVVKALDRIPNFYSPAFPSEYLERLSKCTEFVEFLSQTTDIKQTEEFSNFLSKWNLSTFFDMVKSEITAPILPLLKEPNLEAFLSHKPSKVYTSALESLWSQAGALPYLEKKFQRLSLQIISTYLNYATKSLNALSKSEGIGIQSLSALIHETKEIQRLLRMPPGFQEESFKILQNVVDPCTRCLSEAVTRQCLSNIESLRTIPAIYRMSNKPFPDKPSPFVESFLKPLKQLLVPVPKQVTLEKVCVRYLEVVNETLEAIHRSGDLMGKLKENLPEQKAKMTSQLKLDSAFFIEEVEQLERVEQVEVIKQIINSLE